MELFKTILRKVLYPKNTDEELLNVYVPKLKSCIGIFNTIMPYNNAVPIYKNPKYRDFVFYTANTLLFYDVPMIRSNISEQTIYDKVSTKYVFLKKNAHTFMDIPNDDFLVLFCDIQKHYMAFAKLANIWKYKRTHIQVECDLYMTPLNRTDRNVFSLLQHGKIYLFTCPNLVKIIGTSLSNAPNFFVEPLVIKNPYNNIPLNKHDLYNIYFFLKESPIVMPILFHNYFLVNFDLRKFSDENENIIKNIAFKSYVRNTSADVLYSSAVQMLKKYQKKIIIHKDFPKETIINILRPYLLLYYIIEYSTEEYKIYEAEMHLKYKLKRLYEYNPAFGRKIVKLQRVGFANKMMKIIEFSSKHPYFDEQTDTRTFHITHLEMVDANYHNYQDDENNMREQSESTGSIEEDDEENYENSFPFVIMSPHPSFSFQNTLTIFPNNANREHEYSYSDSNDESDESNTESDNDSVSGNNEVVIEGDIDSDNDDENDDNMSL